jgi:hypothetical protein
MADRPNLPEIDTYITTEQVATGFKKWRENTSTSPSGCHLGIRCITSYNCTDTDTEDIRHSILQVQTDIINLLFQNGFSPTRWQTVVNVMLEKIPGQPLLYKFRFIHILEADYNLALKQQIFGQRLLQNCEKHDSLGDIQDGFRKGCSTIRTLLHNEIVNDYNKRLRINNFVGMTDISGCFDRIVVPVISLLNIKNGCPGKAVEMHSKMLEEAKYHLKTKQGITSTSYSHSTDTPVHGNGQGAGDSPSQWCQQSAMLFELYANETSGTCLTRRDGSQRIDLPMAAFADDANLIGNDDNRILSLDGLIHKTQTGFTTWNELLYAAGHFMELPKCSCYLSVWDFQEDGYAFMIPPADLQREILVKDMFYSSRVS